MYWARQLGLPLRPAALREVRYATTKTRQTPEDDDGDFRPPWVYSGSRFLIYTTIPLTLVYCAFLADWGEREHIFMPLRRWASTYRQSIFSLSPEEAALARGTNGRADASSDTMSVVNQNSTGTMQTATPTFLPPPPQNGYQPLSEAEIYAIKRQYLGLLPYQQVVDICLTFEAHAPIHVKSSVWPYDIRAAIASIQAQKAQSEQTQTSLGSDATDKSSSSAHGDGEASGERAAQDQPSSSQRLAPPPTQTGSGSSASTSSSTQPVVPQSSIPSPAQGSHYPHHPYYHPTYPHAPYYTPPPATYGYPYPYPQPPPMYPVNPASHHPPLFTNTPLTHPPHHAPETAPPLGNADDLPSYEEMIVEALIDSGDAEGCAPKSLFSWMAMHYPLQTNFRPSASQALQKAYKRGRLEKGSNGKYRLNENWEGGNTSKRTTRRPQTLAQTALPGGPHPPSAPPFTHTPLIPHGATIMQTRPLPPGQPPGYGGYPFVYPYSGASGSAQASVPRDGFGTTSQKQTIDGADHEIAEGSDAWEAAQNILKAINFGQLFQISNEENKAGESSMSGDLHNSKATADGPDKAISGAPEQSTSPRFDDGEESVELNAEQRAALQAQLALLAAQLAELADVSGDELTHDLDVAHRTVPMSDACMTQAPNEGSVLGESDDDDNEDMVEVPVPVASLTV